MIEINELLLRVPGLSEDEGRLLAKEVAEKLAQILPPASTNSHIDEMKISIQGGQSAMADTIVQQIIRQLNNR